MTWTQLIADLESRMIPEPNSGCWLWLGAATQSHGGCLYGHRILNGKKWKVHRLMWVLCKGEIPPGLFVCHKCDVGLCINPDHLFLGTAADNNKDRRRKKRDHWFKNNTVASKTLAAARKKAVHAAARGEDAGNAKLTENQIIEIRDLRIIGLTQQRIATKYSVSQNTIHRILAGKTWCHV